MESQYSDMDMKRLLPTCSMDNSLNCATADTIFLSQFVLAHYSRNILRSNLLDLLFSQYGVLVSFSRKTTTLISHILHIYAVGSWEKMQRMYASRIVAFVENPRIFAWWCSIVNNPRGNVGQNSGGCSSSHANSSVPPFIKMALPYPARSKMGTMNWN